MNHQTEQSINKKLGKLLGIYFLSFMASRREPMKDAIISNCLP